MQIRRQEIFTGLLVFATAAAAVFVLLLIGAPGTFSTVKTYYVHFDNVGGIKPGAPVNLAGRKIGQVTKLFSPVPLSQRPEDHPNFEALVEMKVSDSAGVFKEVTVTLSQFGLLGEFVIDLTSGDESSGPAPDGFHFIGVRAPDISQFMTEMLGSIKPVATEAEKTLEQLRLTAVNLQRLTGEGSDFDGTMERMKALGDNLVSLSSKEGPLWNAIEKFKGLTGDLQHISSDLVERDTINLTLNSFRSTVDELAATSSSLKDVIGNVGPELESTVRNVQQATDTLKRQPWRLVWPTTKKYPDEETEALPPIVEVNGVPVRRAIPVN